MGAQSVTLPRKMAIGPGAVENIPGICRELGIGRKPFVVADQTTKDICGDDIVDALAVARMGIVADSTFGEVERLRHLAKGCSCIIAAGGGKVIDVGKSAAAQLDMPFFSVPTVPSNDGIASSIAAIRDNGIHKSMEARMPVAVAADTAIMSRAPARMIAAGCGDIMAKVTAVRDWKLARAAGEAYMQTAADLSLLTTKIVMDSAAEISKRSEAGISDLALALIMAGTSMSLVGSSRPGSGSEHMFSHALDRLGSKGMHGEQCGIGAILMAYWQEKNSKDSQVRNSGVWMKVRDTLKAVGAPVTFREAGIEPAMAYQALVEARGIRDRYTVLTEFPLDLAKAERICRAAGML